MNLHDITDAQIEAYLLGGLGEDESEIIDELAVVVPDFASRVDAVERDLVDEYVRDELDSESRKQFESYYLRSPLRREKVRLARSFTRHMSELTSLSQTDVPTAKFEPHRGSRSFWWKFGIAAFATAILIAITIPLWNISKTGPVDVALGTPTPEIIQSNQNAAPSPPTVNQNANTSTANDGPVKPPVNEASPRPPVIATVFAFTLSPQTRGSQNEKRVSLPATAEAVAVTLELEPTDFSLYRVELRERSSNRVVWQIRSRSLRNQTLKFSVPRKLLPTGSYSFTTLGISGNSEPQIVGDYPFRVVQ